MLAKEKKVPKRARCGLDRASLGFRGLGMAGQG